MSNYNDPFEDASDPSVPPFEVYGEINLDAWFCTVRKGVGKQVYNPQIDKQEDRRTNVDIIVHPIGEMNLSKSMKRSVLTTTNSWAKVTWPSLQRLGVSKANEANNRFCKCKMAGTGRKFTGTDGEEREETTFEFLALYGSREECESAYANRFAESGGSNGAAGEPVDQEKAGALRFAAACVKNAKAQTDGDFEAFRNLVATKLASMAVTAKYFTVDSPEIAQMMAEYV